GMSAQSVRLNTVASNLANADSVAGNPTDAYHSRHPVFKTVQMQTDAFAPTSADKAGVKVSHIVESTADTQAKYDPTHPMADNNGYIYMSNVNVVQEMADMISASRTYQTNAQILNTTKELMMQTINLGR